MDYPNLAGALVPVPWAPHVVSSGLNTTGHGIYILDIPTGFRRLIGIAEILAGIGLVLPALTGILPWLTPLAAAGLAFIMIGAVIFHIPRKETPNIVFNLILLALAAFVAYGRFIVLPI